MAPGSSALPGWPPATGIPPVSRPWPQLLELDASKVAHFTAFDHQAIMAAWLLARRAVPWAEVEAEITSARPSARLNANHEKQLRVWTGWKEFPGLPDWM